MNKLNLNNQGVIITDWLSPDERYCIFLDELYDIHEKKIIGNIWENFENFKFFIRYSTSVSNLKIEIKESIYGSLNGMVITESINENIIKNKEILKSLINEGLFGDFIDWAKETGKSTVSGLRDFVKTTYKGAGDLIDKISDFELKEVFELMAKGSLYLLRKLRDALYHPVGLILDAILIATGVGKAVQWIPWALVTALGIYEIATGQYEEPLWLKILFTLFDAVAMLTTGAVAKGLRLTLKGITKIDDVAKVAKSNKVFGNFLKKIPEILNKISPKLSQASTYLKNKFPKGAKFIESLIPKVDNFIDKVIESFGKFFSKKGLKTAAITTGVLFGFDQLINNVFNSEETELTPEEMESIGGELDMEFW